MKVSYRERPSIFSVVYILPVRPVPMSVKPTSGCVVKRTGPVEGEDLLDGAVKAVQRFAMIAEG